MGISKGAINDCVMCASRAILKLQKKAVKCLDEDERKQISTRIQQAPGFVKCVGLIDSTLFPLASAPTLNSEDYYGSGFQKGSECHLE